MKCQILIAKAGWCTEFDEAEIVDARILKRGKSVKWCRLRDSNPRPTVYKTVALPLC
jgi:hypothetical protein